MWKLLLDRLKTGPPRDAGEIARMYEQPPLPYAARFPDIPPPNTDVCPILVAAQWTCGLILPEDMPAVAADLLEDFDTPYLRRLAGEMNVQSRRDIEDLVGRTFRELAVPYAINLTTARKMVTREIAREVIAGKRNLWQASLAIANLTDWNWKSEIKELYTIYFLMEEADLDCGRPIAEISEDLIETFAELGAKTAGERFLASAGALEGKGWIADDFDGPLPDELQAYFDGSVPDPLLDDPSPSGPAVP